MRELDPRTIAVGSYNATSVREGSQAVVHNEDRSGHYGSLSTFIAASDCLLFYQSADEVQASARVIADRRDWPITSATLRSVSGQTDEPRRFARSTFSVNWFYRCPLAEVARPSTSSELKATKLHTSASEIAAPRWSSR